MKKSVLFAATLLAFSLVSCGDEGKKYPASVLNSGWGQEAAIASYEALGVAVPYIENAGFEYQVGVDEYGDATINFYVFYETDKDANDAFDEYISICEYYGYSGEVTTKTYIDYETYTIYEYESCIVDRVILDHHGIELQFLVSTYKEKPCLGIFGMTYLYVDENEYPLLALEEIFGADASIFPVIEEEGAKFYFQFYIDEDTKDEALYLSVSNVSYQLEEWYFNAINSIEGSVIICCNDYTETAEIALEYPGFNADGSYYYALVKDYTVIFEFSLTYYALVIQFYPTQVME